MADLAAECRRAIALIDKALAEPAAAVTADADQALGVLVRVRDTLIDERRRGDRGRAGLLLRVKGVLSLAPTPRALLSACMTRHLADEASR